MVLCLLMASGVFADCFDVFAPMSLISFSLSVSVLNSEVSEAFGTTIGSIG